MLEHAVKETFKVSVVAGILLLAVICLVLYVQAIDKRNLKITNARISDLKVDIKELKEENRQDKQMLSQALETFDRTTREFQSINKNLSEMKIDINIIKKSIE